MSAAHLTALPGEVDGRRREIVTPEGVPIPVVIASAGDRMVAVLIDAVIIVFSFFVLIAAIVTLAITLDATLAFGFGFLGMFLLRNGYFVAFELLWRGATPGKRMLGIRVVDSRGGPLQTEAIFVRNMMRELEIFLPLAVLIAPGSLWPGASGWMRLLASLWVLVFLFLPLFNRDRRRVGDLAGGTLVVVKPRVALLQDLSRAPAAKEGTASARYTFTREQLAKYGVYELQVLEQLLRRRTPASQRTLREVCGKIQKKIGWPEDGEPVDVLPFLRDFYTAQRAALEQGLLFGQRREDKHDTGDDGAKPRHRRS